MKVVGLQTFIWSNNIKSIVLLCLFPVILSFVIFMGLLGLVIAAGDSSNVFEDAFNLFITSSCCVWPGVGLWFLIAWGFNEKMISSMTHAHAVTRQENPRIYNIVENLAISRGLPVPRINIIDDSSLNAYASGLSPKSAVIAFSRGLIDKLNDNEIEAVAAHELTHIINRDTRLMVICIIFVGIIQTLSEVILRVNIRSDNDKNSGQALLIIFAIKLIVFIIGFFFTIAVQMAISRKREFLADAGSVELTKSSEYLISALQKISQDPAIEAVNNHSIAQIFTYNPLKSNQGFITKIFATHPPLDERISALKLIG